MTLPNSLLLCGEDIAGSVERTLREHSFSSLCVLVDENTKEHCYPVIRDSLPGAHVLIEIRSGEEHKNIDTCQVIWREMTRVRLDRNAFLINLGGGVIGDMGGFCAATYKRGIPFINIPTTLLAQVDASIGGKLGIDFDGLKNHIGVFANPFRVLIYPGFLETLSHRELLSGYAEVIKHALIRDDKKFDELCGYPQLDHLDWHDIVAHSIEIKNQVVEEDPYEQGLRKILNYGHTIGHGIESHYLNGRKEKMLHGEAIAIGMICEAFLSARKTGLSEEAPFGIARYILGMYNLPFIDQDAMHAVARLAVQDKKNAGSRIKASLLDRIGSCTYDIEISAEEIMDSIKQYNELLH